jgi:hypothetical protein
VQAALGGSTGNLQLVHAFLRVGSCSFSAALYVTFFVLVATCSIQNNLMIKIHTDNAGAFERSWFTWFWWTATPTATAIWYHLASGTHGRYMNFVESGSQKWMDVFVVLHNSMIIMLWSYSCTHVTLLAFQVSENLYGLLSSFLLCTFSLGSIIFLFYMPYCLHLEEKEMEFVLFGNLKLNCVITWNPSFLCNWMNCASRPYAWVSSTWP